MPVDIGAFGVLACSGVEPVVDAGSALGSASGTLAAATGWGWEPGSRRRRRRRHPQSRGCAAITSASASVSSSPIAAPAIALATAGMSGSGSVAAGSEPSSARATDGKATADAPASAAATMHVATRALSMETMHFHLCIELKISIHHFTRSVLDIACVWRYVSDQKGWWIGVAYRGTAEEVQRRRSNAVLLTAYHRRGDRSARTRVIEQNLPLVHSLARRFSRPSDSIDDLVQVGAIGLIKAVDGFRADRGSDLGAYAVPTIVGELRRHLRERLPAREAGERSTSRPARVTVLSTRRLSSRRRSSRSSRARTESSSAPDSVRSALARGGSSRSASIATSVRSGSPRRWALPGSGLPRTRIVAHQDATDARGRLTCGGSLCAPAPGRTLAGG